MGNIYSHNCMMHKDTMLKCQVLWAHIKVSAYEVRKGASSPTLNFGTPSLSQKLIELGSWKLAHLQSFMRTSARYKNLSARGRLGKSGAFCYSFSVDTSFNVRCILYVVTSVTRPAIHVWCQKFAHGWESVGDEKYPGRRVVFCAKKWKVVLICHSYG